MLSDRLGRGSVSTRSAAADAGRAFVVPFDSVSVVPARPASAFPALRSRSLRRASPAPGLLPSLRASFASLSPGYRQSLLPYLSPRQRPSVDFQALPQLVHIGQDVLGEVLVHRWRLTFLSAPMAGAGKPWTPGNGAGRPGRQRRRETGKARRDPPGFARITLQWLKMNHTPGAGQAGRRRPRAPRVDQQTAKQDGPSRSRDRPTPTRYGGYTRKGRRRGVRRVLSPKPS